jgi:transglutaminase-like putative cysteine protease
LKLAIVHTTHYRYAQALRYAVQTLWLTPATGPTQTVLDWHIKAPSVLYAQRDGSGNTIQTYTFVGSAMDSVVQASGVVQTHSVHHQWEGQGSAHPLMYLRTTPLTEPHPRLAAFTRETLPAAPQEHDILHLAWRVSQAVQYNKTATHVGTTALEAFDWGAGVCQDQAHVMIAACRSVGLPARYVSGYFYAANEPDLASHAWVDVCLNEDERHWISVDITHACATDERHVRLAVGLDYAACPPIKGIRQGGGKESMQVDVAIEALA